MKQICIFCIITLMVACFGTDPQKTDREGKPFPAFNILLSDSTTWYNTSQIPRDKPIALFYFSPYCPYCRAQTEEIIEDIDKLKEIQFYFVTRYPFPSMNEFYKEYKLAKYPNITIGLDTAHFVGDYFEVTGVPYIAIYGKDHKLNKAFMGKIYSSQIKKVAEE